MTNNELSDSTKSINQSAMFLQSLISKELDFDGWSVDVEHPVQITPYTADSIKHGSYSLNVHLKSMYHPRKIILSMENYKNKIELEEISIDVVGLIEQDPTINLRIECKKLDPIMVFSNNIGMHMILNLLPIIQIFFLLIVSLNIFKLKKPHHCYLNFYSLIQTIT